MDVSPPCGSNVLRRPRLVTLDILHQLRVHAALGERPNRPFAQFGVGSVRFVRPLGAYRTIRTGRFLLAALGQIGIGTVPGDVIGTVKRATEIENKSIVYLKKKNNGGRTIGVRELTAANHRSDP